MKYEVYRDSANEYRWRLKASNGHIIAVSSEGYTVKQNALNSISIVKSSTLAEVSDLTQDSDTPWSSRNDRNVR